MPYLNPKRFGDRFCSVPQSCCDKTSAPFIGLNAPFICASSPGILHFVWHFRPLVGFGASGFTLIELIITLSIAAIVLMSTVPGFQSLVQNSQSTSQINDVAADFAFARTEAVKRAAIVRVCKSTDPYGTPPTCDANTASLWTPGRVVWIDLDTDGTVDANEVLRVTGPLGTGSRLVGDGSSTGTAKDIAFTATGGTSLVPVSGNENQLILCDSRGAAYGRAIAIRKTTGRVRLTDKGKDMSGSAISSATCPTS